MKDELVLADGARVSVLVQRSSRSRGWLILLAGLGGDALTNAGLYGELAQASLADADVLRLSFERPPPSVTHEVEAAVLASRRAGSSQVVLVGHSAGGVLAPLAAAACERAGVRVAGVVTLGSPACRWVEALAIAAAEQLRLKGQTGTVWERESARARLLYQAVLRSGHTRATLAEREPRLLDCIAAGDLTQQTLHGASLVYLRSLDAIDPARAFALTNCPSIQFVGEHDWIVGPAARSKDATILARADHYLAAHDSMVASFAAFSAGRTAPIQPDALAAVVLAASAALTRSGAE